jgi:hypothetical protein
MWNFVGRQNDRQGRGNVMNGNWISGMEWIDNARLGPQEKLPDWLKNNKARNRYFFLPLLAGLLGAWWQYKKHREGFWVVLALFIMGGLGLTVYINEVPITPRERDYVFVGAFMAFAIWIGMSFWALAEICAKYVRSKASLFALLVFLMAIVPGLLLLQNFNDHNRSGRTAARDYAKNILQSCPPNAILFTSGDNDTYPLLYCQEVEGIRTDVRVVITPFLSANWFIEGLRKQKYNDPPLDMTLPQQKYDFGELDYIPIIDRIKRDTSWKEALRFISNKDERTKVKMSSGKQVDFMPVNQVDFKVQTESSSGRIQISLGNKKMLFKNDLVFWDIVSSNAIKRPICFVSKLAAQSRGLQHYLQSQGFVFQLIAEKNPVQSTFSLGNFNPEDLFQKIMNEYEWGNIAAPNVYADWNTVVNLNVFQGRNLMNEVATSFLNSGKKEKAISLLEKSAAEIPVSKIPYDYFVTRQLELLIAAGANTRAQDLFAYLETQIIQTLEYYSSLNFAQLIGLRNEVQKELMYMNNLVVLASKMNKPGKSEELKEKLNGFARELSFSGNR